MSEGTGEQSTDFSMFELRVSFDGTRAEQRARMREVYARLADTAGVRLEAWQFSADGVGEEYPVSAEGSDRRVEAALSAVELQARLDTDINTAFKRNGMEGVAATRIVGSLTKKNRLDGTLRQIIVIGRDRLEAMSGIGDTSIAVIEQCLKAELGNVTIGDGTPESAAQWCDTPSQIPAIVLEGRPSYGTYTLKGITLDRILDKSAEEVAELLPEVWSWDAEGRSNGRKFDIDGAHLFKQRADRFMSRFNAAKHVAEPTS